MQAQPLLLGLSNHDIDYAYNILWSFHSGDNTCLENPLTLMLVNLPENPNAINIVGIIEVLCVDLMGKKIPNCGLQYILGCADKQGNLMDGHARGVAAGVTYENWDVMTLEELVQKVALLLLVLGELDNTNATLVRKLVNCGILWMQACQGKKVEEMTKLWKQVVVNHHKVVFKPNIEEYAMVYDNAKKALDCKKSTDSFAACVGLSLVPSKEEDKKTSDLKSIMKDAANHLLSTKMAEIGKVKEACDTLDCALENHNTDEHEKLKQELKFLGDDIDALKTELGVYGIHVPSIWGQNKDKDEDEDDIFARDLRMWWRITLSKYKNNMEEAARAISSSYTTRVHFASWLVCKVEEEDVRNEKRKKEKATRLAISQFQNLQIVKSTAKCTLEDGDFIPGVIELCVDENWSKYRSNSISLVPHKSLVKKLWNMIHGHDPDEHFSKYVEGDEEDKEDKEDKEDEQLDISNTPFGISFKDVYQFFEEVIVWYCDLKEYNDEEKQIVFVSDVRNLIAAMRIMHTFLDVVDSCNEVPQKISLHCLQNCLTIILGSAPEMMKSMKFLDCILAVVKYEEAIYEISNEDDSKNQDLATLDGLKLPHVLSLFGSCVPSPRLKIEFGERGEDKATLNNLSDPILFQGGRGCRPRLEPQTLVILALEFKAAIKAGLIKGVDANAMIACAQKRKITITPPTVSRDSGDDAEEGGHENPIREKKKRSDMEEDDAEARPAKKSQTATTVRHAELAIMEDMLRENRTAIYKHKSTFASFEHWINTFWKEGICESCENGLDAALVECEHFECVRVHKYCSFLCRECRDDKTSAMTLVRAGWKHNPNSNPNPYIGRCPHCVTQNVKGVIILE